MRRLLTSADLRRAARLDPEVELRPERFGALAYHFGTRRLSIVRRRTDETRSLNDELESGLDSSLLVSCVVN